MYIWQLDKLSIDWLSDGSMTNSSVHGKVLLNKKFQYYVKP